MARKLISTGSPFEKTAGYSRAVVDGDWMFVAGTTGYNYETMEMPEDVIEQTRNCFATIEKTLTDAGFELSDIVRAVYYVIDKDLVDIVFPVIGEYMGDIRPAATMVVADLVDDLMKIEIEVTAKKSS